MKQPFNYVFKEDEKSPLKCFKRNEYTIQPTDNGLMVGIYLPDML